MNVARFEMYRADYIQILQSDFYRVQTKIEKEVDFQKIKYRLKED